MKFITMIAPLFASLKKLVSVPQASNINEDMLAIEKMLALDAFTSQNSHEPIGKKSLWGSNEKFTKLVTHSDITIATSQEYIVIMPSVIVYYFKNKHYDGYNKHKVTISRMPFDYLQDQSSVKPHMAREFMERYVKALGASK